jgi:hypothetical protein
MRRIVWIPIIYIILFALLLIIVWAQLDKPAIIAIVSVIAGGLAGIIGSFAGGIITLKRIETESEIKLKEYASSQALELTKLELELRRKEGRQRQFLAAAKIYREFYKALFELYETKTWPKAIEDQGLLTIYDFSHKETDSDKEDK